MKKQIEDRKQKIMGQNIKYGDLKKLSDDVEIIQIIDKLYEGRGDEAILDTCEFSHKLDSLEIYGQLREKFWCWLRKAIEEINSGLENRLSQRPHKPQAAGSTPAPATNSITNYELRIMNYK